MPSNAKVAEKENSVKEKVTDVRNRTMDLAAVAIPKVAETARQTGHSLADFVAATGESIASALKSEQFGNLAKAGLSLSAAQIAGKQILRFATRRPVLLLVGGFAVAQLGLAIHRRMNEKSA